MGIPALFRWLSRKYPCIVEPCHEEKPKEVCGIQIPVDTSQPNPNNVEFDNLYLDMNGIIHPCCNPDNNWFQHPQPLVTSHNRPQQLEVEMMTAVFDYIDRIFSMVRPRRLLYMAIDGVAPRAKMNQHRSHRFRASNDYWEKK
jgi:5'-3' exoribonuclease 2